MKHIQGSQRLAAHMHRAVCGAAPLVPRARVMLMLHASAGQGAAATLTAACMRVIGRPMSAAAGANSRQLMARAMKESGRPTSRTVGAVTDASCLAW